MAELQPPPREQIRAQCAQALAEDLAPAGQAPEFDPRSDSSSDPSAALIPPAPVRAELLCREDAVLCGRPWFDEVMRQMDAGIRIDWLREEGSRVRAGERLCTLHGPARALLGAERSALNFLQTLSATATLTRRYVDAIAGTGARLLDTRKTLPGLRLAQKYAVRAGGGENHRLGLYDMIMLKENHIIAAGSIAAAVQQARKAFPALDIEVEVENLEELRQALEAAPERILLDNMDPERLRAAVELTAGRIPLEASGNVTLDNIREIALSGVDYISTGAITKNIQAIDLSLRFLTEA